MAIDPTVLKWVNRQVADLAHRGLVPGSPRETDLLQHWLQNRPKMMHRLDSAGMAEKLAFVLDQKRWEARQQYIAAGMPPPDAEEQAMREWCLMEPEDEPQTQPLPAPISTLTTQSE